MRIINIESKEQLNNFVDSQSSRISSQFLQAWEWGEFHKKMDSKIFRLAVEDEQSNDDSKIIAIATFIKKTLPMGKNYFYCPRGPIINEPEIKKSKLKIEDVLNFLFNEIQKIAKDEQAMFLRLEPSFKIQSASCQTKFKIIETVDIQPRKTVILNLEKSEEELLKNMHPKTRYNIRLAEKKGVKIIEDKFENFWKLLCETSDRDQFRTHGIDYYKKMTEVDKNFIKLFFAEYKKKNISAIVVSFFKNTVTYIHGASSDEYRNVMSPYALQWHCIKLAKKLGYKYYDFYGIDDKKWPGVTKFKNGFGGQNVEYPGTFDLIFDNGWYNVYKMVRKVRRTF